MDDCWDMEKVEKMTGDSLKLLRVLFIDPFSNKYARVCIFVSFIIHILFWAVQFYYFMNPFNVDLFMMHIPSALALLYALLSMLIPTLLNKEMIYFVYLKNNICWSLNTCSEDLKKIIRRQSSYLVYICVGNLILALITYVTIIMRYNSGKPEIIYQIVFIEEHFPKHANVLVRIFQASLIVFMLPMISVVYIEGYFVMHMTFQLKMICEKSDRITEGYQDNTELIDDENYQRQIHKRLRFFIIRIQQLKSFTTVTLQLVPIFVVTYTILIMLLVVSYLAAYYLNTEQYRPLLCSIIIVSCYTAVVGFEIGQMAEDASLKVYDTATSLPWYTFNIKNRKMLLFVIQNSKDPITISPYKMFPISRQSIVKLFKVFSTVSAFLAKTRDGLIN